MKPFLRLASVLMVATSASLVAACDNKAPEQTETAAASAEGASAAAAGPFDVNSVALSTASLGDFPYLRLPEGYKPQNSEAHDFADFPFWTGARFEMIEGRVHQTQITNDTGKSFSRLELLRNMEHALKEAGAVRIFDGQIPSDAAHALPEAVQMASLNGIGDIYNGPSQTWVIRQADRTVWIHLYVGSAQGSMAVVEAKALAPTAGLLPAGELARKIAADGRVAVPVEFALDKADILDASRPQIDAMAQMLKDEAGLRLSVEGHTDNTGAPARNRALSEERARAVVAALTQQGIDAKRLEAKGFGADKPVADNASDEGRARNRRVELVRLP